MSFTLTDALQSIQPDTPGWKAMNFSCSDAELSANPNCFKTRNAGGPQYFHFLANHPQISSLTKADFMEVHKAYCPVSGSPVRYTEANGKVDSFHLTVEMETTTGGETVCGEYHMCCSPCFCDIQRFSKVDTYSMTLADGTHDIDVLTIKDPCKNPIPEGITSFKCKNGRTENAVKIDDRIIIGVLQNRRACSAEDTARIAEDKSKYCSERSTASREEIRTMGGMGDLFTELACNHDGCPEDENY